MKPNRLATVLSLVTGIAGLTTLARAESIPIAIIGSTAFLGSAVFLLRHFWRLSERSRQSQAEGLSSVTTDLTEIRGLATSSAEQVRAISQRVDAFARGVLEESAQLQIDLSKYASEVEASRSGMTSQIADTTDVLKKQLDAATERREMILGQLEGIVSLYTVLKPDRPFPKFGGWAISADTARRLVRLIMDCEASWVIETGSGLSTLLAAQTLELLGGDGRVISLEHDKEWLDVTSALLRDNRVDHRVELVHSPLVEVELNGEMFPWYDLSNVTLPQAEVVFVDGPPMSTGPLARYPALPLLWRHMSPGGTMLMDDAARADETEVIRRWSDEFNGLQVIKHRDLKGSAEIRLPLS